MARVYRRVMRAALRPPTLLHLESPGLQDKIKQSLNEGWAGPRAATNGLVGWTTQRLQGVLALLVVAHFSWPLALLLAVSVLWHLRRIHAVHKALMAVRFLRTEPMRRADDLAESLTAAGRAKEVRIFGLGTWFADRFEEAWQGAMVELWQRRGAVAPRIAQAVLPVLAAEALGFWLVGRAAVAGEIGLGALVVYAGAILRSYALGDVSQAELMLQYGTSGLKPLADLETLVQCDPRLALPGTRPTGGLPQREIRFAGVAFRYPGGSADVFSGLDLEIPAGRSLAIVGENGAGKTTLVKLLCRLYEPDAGRITVDGVDLRGLDPRAWQRRVAAIFQDFVQYQLPAYDNVALGAVGASGPSGTWWWRLRGGRGRST